MALAALALVVFGAYDSYPFPQILPHGSQKRDKLGLAITHSSMGCDMDAKSSKNKANKMGVSKKKAQKEPIVFSGNLRDYVVKSLKNITKG